MEEKIIIKNVKEPNNFMIWAVVSVLLLLLALVAVLKYKELRSSESVNTALVAELDESCDLHKGPCKLSFENGGSISFSISPKHIPLLEKIYVDVELDGIDAKDIEIDFSGIGIDMGYNRPKLKAISDNKYVSEAFLPICTLSEMDWNAKVLLHTDKGLMMAPYKFHTTKKASIYNSFK